MYLLQGSFAALHRIHPPTLTLPVPSAPTERYPPFPKRLEVNMDDPMHALSLLFLFFASTLPSSPPPLFMSISTAKQRHFSTASSPRVLHILAFSLLACLSVSCITDFVLPSSTPQP
ncbi:hypothetical protein FPSE5266_20403 [Fusarium pseudograminearum]|nr:hypothetical protein FPSE5266_20403 [Fusarium pseudograminearum]